MEASRESTKSSTENEHKNDEPAPPRPLVRKKLRYRSGADHVDPTDTPRSKPRSEKQKVIYQNVELAIANVIDGNPGDIAYELRYRKSEERYRDGDKEEFKGDELQDDPSDPYGSARQTDRCILS